ncbi:MAG: arylsulfatase [Phycisphaerales bacterium]|nr:arylsulfatase [Phycisphaerales bacterium]
MGVGAAALVVGSAGRAWAKADGARRPNVILVMTDDQGYGDLGCHGNTMIRTPSLDKLHAESLRLTDFHVSPVCTPTRASLMTGRDSVRVGAWATTWGRSLPYADEVMMPAVFKSGGYRTGMFGKWHLGDNYPFRPQDRGFEHVVYHGGGGVGQTPDYWGNDYFDDTYFHNGKPKKHSGYCTDIWFDEAAKFITANKDRPFFAYISTNAPHGPLNVAAKYSQPYVKKGVPGNMAKFYGMIENIDENMGKLIARLDELGLAKNTILIFMTDNGTANGGRASNSKKWTGFNAGMRGKKGSIYDGGHRVPCFWRWPGGGLGGGRDLAPLTAHIDMLPTLIDLCGLKAPGEVKFDGVSLAPLLSGRAKTLGGRTVTAQNRQSNSPPAKWSCTIMSGKWRLVGGKQLFDIKTDSGQRKDIAAQHPEIVKKLRATGDRRWTEVSKRFDEPSRIVLGSDAENPSCLTGFDWCAGTPWNQGHVRGGSAIASYWMVQVARSGTYEIALARWPEEADTPINGAVKGGRAIKVSKARLKIGQIDQTIDVAKSDKTATFRVKLKPGPAKLQTWFINPNGAAKHGAYYAYVKRL